MVGSHVQRLQAKARFYHKESPGFVEDFSKLLNKVFPELHKLNFSSKYILSSDISKLNLEMKKLRKKYESKMKDDLLLNMTKIEILDIIFEELKKLQGGI